MTRAILDEATIKARPGSRLSNEDAKVIAPVLFRLEQERGGFTPADVLAEARDPGSPLHRFFEWDDTVAAEKHRLQVAATLTRSVVYRVMTIGPEMQKYTPVFPTVKQIDQAGVEGRKYRSLPYVLEQPDLKKQMMDQAVQKLEATIRHFRTLEALASEVPELETVLQRVRAAVARAA
jgi:hypothetical protein